MRYMLGETNVFEDNLVSIYLFVVLTHQHDTAKLLAHTKTVQIKKITND